MLRTVAAMNNIGVAFLERGRLVKACTCFNEAIRMLKMIGDEANCGSAMIHHREIQAQEAYANQCRELARQTMDKTTKFCAIVPHTLSDDIITSISCDTNLEAMYPLLLDSITDMPFDLASSILMYNNGLVHMISHMYLQDLPKSATQAPTQGVCAFKLLTYAESILSNAMVKFGQDDSVYDNIVLVACLVTRTFLQLFDYEKDTVAVQEFLVKLQKLVEAALEYDSLLRSAFAAAAAA